MTSIQKKPSVKKKTSRHLLLLSLLGIIVLCILIAVYLAKRTPATSSSPSGGGPISAADAGGESSSANVWISRALAVNQLYRDVYTPCWEGAYGAIGDAYLFLASHDSSLIDYHLKGHPLTEMCAGTWVDDRAWVCLAEVLWWKVTGRQYQVLVDDARRRYDEARTEGRLSHIEGFWSWYNYPPGPRPNPQIFTNSNMNQMATVAAQLYEATGDQHYFKDAILVWNGDKQYPGIRSQLYKGDGLWEGKPGLAAFGKQLPWEGTEYCSLGASLYRITNDSSIKNIVVATARRIMNPGTGWVDNHDYFQIRMDGNGAFVNYLLDAYSIAPQELHFLLGEIDTMLEHVWTNHNGMATVTLHRTSDNGIRNGWNPHGGEDGYGVDEVGTVHAQGEAMRAFGTFAYYYSLALDSSKSSSASGAGR